MPDISGRVKKEGAFFSCLHASAVSFENQDGSGGLERRLLADDFFDIFFYRSNNNIITC
jgi:hypothetical protein